MQDIKTHGARGAPSSSGSTSTHMPTNDIAGGAGTEGTFDDTAQFGAGSDGT